MRLAGAGIIIDDKGRILLLKRNEYTNAFPHYWAMPAGRGEEGETPEEAAVREVGEETGLKFTPEKLYYKSEQENSGEIIHAYRYLGTWEGTITVQVEEADGYAWYTYEETKSLKIAFDYPEIIEKLYNDGLIK